MMRKTMRIAALLAFLPWLQPVSASAEVKLAGGGHFQGTGKAMAEAFSKKTGVAARYTPGNTGNGGMKMRMDMGEDMDVVVLNTDDMAAQMKAGLIRPESVVGFARDRMGFAVKKGSARVDISTPAKLRVALLTARAVGMQEPDPKGHSGANILTILSGLGTRDEILKKAVIIKEPATALIEDKADISFWSYPELLTRSDVDVLGPAPVELGGFTDQSVGIPVAVKNMSEAEAFIRFLAGPDGAAVYTKTGLDPVASASQR